MNDPLDLGPMPTGRRMRTVDEIVVHTSVGRIFELARAVDQWPAHLSHYRWVRFRDTRSDGGGIVEMAAYRPFGALNWPTWWLSEMQVIERAPAIRFRHIGGVTRGMDVEWSFTPAQRDLTPNAAHEATLVRIVHLWDGRDWPVVGGAVAVHLIGPVFVHGIASRTLAGLAAVAEHRPSAPGRTAEAQGMASSDERSGAGTSGADV
jgi:hypothetical protein